MVFSRNSAKKNKQQNRRTFAKNPPNYRYAKKENRKILTGTSRKKSFADFFKDTSKTKLSASLLSGIICALGGSNIIRSHEVKHLREELEKLGIYER